LDQDRGLLTMSSSKEEPPTWITSQECKEDVGKSPADG
jgi:hypothetical protein